MPSKRTKEVISESTWESGWSDVSTVPTLGESDRQKGLADFTHSLHADIRGHMETKRVIRLFRSQCFDMIAYFVFLLTFSLVVYGARDPLYAFQYNEFMKDLFLAEEFPGPDIYKTFYDVATFEEFWEYMNDVFVDAMFADQGGFGPGYIYGQNVIVGTVRIRQVRVNPGVCQVEIPFNQVFSREQCFPRYDSTRVSKASYGPDNVFKFRDNRELGSYKQIARLQVYDGGGFVEDFSPEDPIALHREHMANMTRDAYVDLQTRVVFVDFTTYNTNINIFHVAQMTFEFLPSGGVFPASTFRTMRLYKYQSNTAWGVLQIVGEILLLVFVTYYLVLEIYELVKHGPKVYFSSGWNYVDGINVLLFMAVVVTRTLLVVQFERLDLDVQRRRTYYNFQTLSLLNSAEQNILAVNAFILWFKVFKYLQFLPRMKVIIFTIVSSFKNTASFVVMFTFVLFGFSQAGNLAFGTDVADFRTFTDTFFTLLRAALGDFDFEAMQYSNRAFGPIYFLAYMILVFFIMLSMFLAILNDSYLETQEKVRSNSSAQEQTVVSLFGSWLKSKATSLQQQVDDADDLEAGIEEGDVNDDALLDQHEVQLIFQQYEVQCRRLLGVSNAEELLARFDFNTDGVLDRNEQARLLATLTSWREAAEVERHSIDPTIGSRGDGIQNLAELSETDIVGHYVHSLKRDVASFESRLTGLLDNLASIEDALGVSLTASEKIKVFIPPIGENLDASGSDDW